MESVSSKMNELSLSGNTSLVTPPTNSTECSTSEDQVQDIDRKIRALKKKVNLYSTSSILFWLSCLKYLLRYFVQLIGLLSLSAIYIQINPSARVTTYLELILVYEFLHRKTNVLSMLWKWSISFLLDSYCVSSMFQRVSVKSLMGEYYHTVWSLQYGKGRRVRWWKRIRWSILYWRIPTLLTSRVVFCL